VTEVLIAALAKQLSSLAPPAWHFRSVHRWRYARHRVRSETEVSDCWWDSALGLGVCGDAFGDASGNARGEVDDDDDADGNVEAAWRSGDELADAMCASFDTVADPLTPPEPGFEIGASERVAADATH
jgi:predicted NAD/FAD-dependent oxidoreductase